MNGKGGVNKKGLSQFSEREREREREREIDRERESEYTDSLCNLSLIPC